MESSQCRQDSGPHVLYFLRIEPSLPNLYCPTLCNSSSTASLLNPTVHLGRSVMENIVPFELFLHYIMLNSHNYS